MSRFLVWILWAGSVEGVRVDRDSNVWQEDLQGWVDNDLNHMVVTTSSDTDGCSVQVAIANKSVDYLWRSIGADSCHKVRGHSWSRCPAGWSCSVVRRGQDGLDFVPCDKANVATAFSPIDKAWDTCEKSDCTWFKMKDCGVESNLGCRCVTPEAKDLIAVWERSKKFAKRASKSSRTLKVKKSMSSACVDQVEAFNNAYMQEFAKWGFSDARLSGSRSQRAEVDLIADRVAFGNLVRGVPAGALLGADVAVLSGLWGGFFIQAALGGAAGAGSGAAASAFGLGLLAGSASVPGFAVLLVLLGLGADAWAQSDQMRRYLKHLQTPPVVLSDVVTQSFHTFIAAVDGASLNPGTLTGNILDLPQVDSLSKCSVGDTEEFWEDHFDLFFKGMRAQRRKMVVVTLSGNVPLEQTSLWSSGIPSLGSAMKKKKKGKGKWNPRVVVLSQKQSCSSIAKSITTLLTSSADRPIDVECQTCSGDLHHCYSQIPHMKCSTLASGSCGENCTCWSPCTTLRDPLACARHRISRSRMALGYALYPTESNENPAHLKCPAGQERRMCAAKMTRSAKLVVTKVGHKKRFVKVDGTQTVEALRTQVSFKKLMHSGVILKDADVLSQVGVAHRGDNVEIVSDLGVDADNGAHYRGSVAEAADGSQCRRWQQSEQNKWKNKGLEGGHSFCRNPIPIARDAPWCFVSLHEWRYCNLGKAASSGNRANLKKLPVKSAHLKCCFMKIKKGQGKKHFRWFYKQESDGSYKKLMCPRLWRQSRDAWRCNANNAEISDVKEVSGWRR